jgi:3D (Asp-Asp-Asp) domain-containing protein
MAAKAPPSEITALKPSAKRAESSEEKKKRGTHKTNRSIAGTNLKSADSKMEASFRKGIFTAYTSQRHQTDNSPFTSADGTNLRTVEGCVVANNHLPFGTRVEIETIGECVVRDRGADGHPAHWFDIYMGQNHGRAKSFGRKKLNYRVLH